MGVVARGKCWVEGELGGEGISQPNNADEVEQNKKFAIGFMLRKYSNIQIVENMFSWG